MELMSILCAMGIPTLDENLQEAINAMSVFPAKSALGGVLGWAKMIGFCIALGVGSYECWMMILGRRGMDVMKILRIVIISICISTSSSICSALKMPGQTLENMAYADMNNMNAQVNAMKEAVADQQKEYKKALVERLERGVAEGQAVNYKKNKDGIVVSAIPEAEETGEENNFFTKWAKKLCFDIETTVCEWLSNIIRFLGEAAFQITYYGMLVAQHIFMNILEIFAPLMFALSLAPPWKSAWSQWMSKYLTLSLWGFVVYICVYCVDFMILYFLQNDLAYYTSLTNKASETLGTWTEIGSIGLKGLGTSCMVAVGMFVGMFVLRFVPEVSSWLIPGGVSSGIGQAMGGAATGAAAGGVLGAVAGGGKAGKSK